MKNYVKFKPKDKSLFFPTLKQRVDDYFTINNISKNANTGMVIKTIILLSGYILPFVYILACNPSFIVSTILWTIMGFSMAGVGMSIMHDANHGSYSSSERVNKFLGNTLVLVGGSVANWKVQHNLLHHTFTNVVHQDDDIADKFVLRFSPHTKVKWFHQYQYFYAFFFYGLQTLFWVLAKDFLQFKRYVIKGEQKWFTLTKLLFYKIAYIFVVLIMPVVFFDIPVLHIATGFLVMHFIGGLILTVIFQLAHTVEGTTHPLPNEKNEIMNDWAIHQMNTTVDFAPKNKLLSWYIGGLNFQVEHHLFTKICHIHYPEISKIVQQTAAEFEIPYLVNEKLSDALMAHVNALKRFGKEESGLLV
jgi:linoleoyl-CoA desaturase